MIKCPICSILTSADINWLIAHLIDSHTKIEMVDLIVKAYADKDKEAERVMEWNEWAAEMVREQK